MFKTRRKPRKSYGSKSKNRAQSRRGTGDIHQFISKHRNLKNDAPVHEVTTTFADFQLTSKLNEQLAQAGYIQPTEIQEKTISHSIAGKDVIGIAGTGTGKTAAFLIPIIQGLAIKNSVNRALIVTPTRELASQVADEFRKLTRGMELYYSTLIGGGNVGKSIKDLQKKNHVIIGTPGRLLDMMERRHLKLDDFKILVLDEFDRMLDMGFLPDIKIINKKMASKEQTLLFSATRDASQDVSVMEMTDHPVQVTASAGTQLTHAIDQDVLYVPADRGKDEMLFELINTQPLEKMILFCETKRQVEKVNKKLLGSNVRSVTIHGDKTQRNREVALRKFKKGQMNVLVATDVVARGIDVQDVFMVINYEVPKNFTDYVHRIGRTGRAGKTGKAVTLVGG